MMETTRMHKTGTITAGVTLIAFGVMFIFSTIFNVLSYEFVFSMWPLILVGLGVEILITNMLTDKFVYDKSAVFVIILMSFFAMGMACMDICIKHADWICSL
ncbi:LiaI-LiaF-like domain-containing protein [Butyrivibrio hungatei]|nr:DUF5668 domain-containing protein [Butyrivibrio hungatei]